MIIVVFLSVRVAHHQKHHSYYISSGRARHAGRSAGQGPLADAFIQNFTRVLTPASPSATVCFIVWLGPRVGVS